MKNLTLENTFNELQKKYPIGMKIFCDWIDVWKKKNEWAKLFNIGSPHYAKMGWHWPKYHDLPLAMQLGIWIEFINEQMNEEHEINEEIDEMLTPEGLRKNILQFVEMRQLEVDSGLND